MDGVELSRLNGQGDSLDFQLLDITTHFVANAFCVSQSRGLCSYAWLLYM